MSVRPLEQVRTSFQCWCNFAGCFTDPTVHNVTLRINKLLNIPYNNGEDLQIVRYEPGQFYRRYRPTAPTPNPWSFAHPNPVVFVFAHPNPWSFARPNKCVSAFPLLCEAGASTICERPLCVRPLLSRRHHDQNTAVWAPQGPRVLTFFMYTNPNPPSHVHV
jgi:hypothetical protein